jgi:hypothetical protein
MSLCDKELASVSGSLETLDMCVIYLAGVTGLSVWFVCSHV